MWKFRRQVTSSLKTFSVLIFNIVSLFFIKQSWSFQWLRGVCVFIYCKQVRKAFFCFVLYVPQHVLHRSCEIEFLQEFDCKQSFHHFQCYYIPFNQTVRICNPLFHFFSWLPGRSELKEMLNHRDLWAQILDRIISTPFAISFLISFTFIFYGLVCLLKGTSNIFWKGGKYKL